MVYLTAEMEDKIRRRIRRQIKTGIKQARVHQISKRLFEYKAEHYVTSVFFRKTFFNGLRQVSP